MQKLKTFCPKNSYLKGRQVKQDCAILMKTRKQKATVPWQCPDTEPITKLRSESRLPGTCSCLLTTACICYVVLLLFCFVFLPHFHARGIRSLVPSSTSSASELIRTFLHILASQKGKKLSQQSSQPLEKQFLNSGCLLPSTSPQAPTAILDATSKALFRKEMGWFPNFHISTKGN